MGAHCRSKWSWGRKIWKVVWKHAGHKQRNTKGHRLLLRLAKSMNNSFGFFHHFISFLIAPCWFYDKTDTKVMTQSKLQENALRVIVSVRTRTHTLAQLECGKKDKKFYLVRRRRASERASERAVALTDSEEIFINSSGPGVPTSSIISFNWSISTDDSRKKIHDSRCLDARPVNQNTHTTLPLTACVALKRLGKIK